MEVTIQAEGHENIRARHETTWQLTKETHLTPQGDCIIAVGADTAARDLPDTFKSYLQGGNWIEMELIIGPYRIKGRGQGHPDLSFDDPVDMVFRRSSYTCGRTITINTSFTASDLTPEVVDYLVDSDTTVRINLRPVEKK